MNMQRHLQEQQQKQEKKVPSSSSSSSSPSVSPHSQRRTKVTYHDLERDDDQDKIAQLIENDPYFAAAMEDFVHTHGLLHSPRHRLFIHFFSNLSTAIEIFRSYIQNVHIKSLETMRQV